MTHVGRCHFARSLILILFVAILLSQTVQAQTEKANGTPNANESAGHTTNDAEPDASDKQAGRILTFTLAMWGLFLLLVLFLFAAVLMLGRHARNLTRTKPPNVSDPDPLWHLKGKSAATDDDEPTE